MTLAALQAQNATLQEEVASLRQTLTSTQQQLQDALRENQLLRQKLDALARQCFGPKSEHLDRAQLELLLQGVTSTVVELPVRPASPTPPPLLRRSRPGSQAIRTPEHLDVVQQVIEPPEVQADPQQWRRIGEETSRLLDYQPSKFFWLETVRPKYVAVAQRALPPVVAPAPARVGGQAAPGLLAHLLISKFADHLPFYRQQMIYWERHEVYIARQQMVMWLGQSVVLLEAIVVCLKHEIQARPYLQVDETPVRYMDPETPGRCATGYLWTGYAPGAGVIYEWHPSRAATCLDALLGDTFQGKLQCDGYSAYPAYAHDKPAVTLFGCWAHARRGFFEAKDQAPGPMGWVLRQIGWLYHWEDELRQARAGPVLREVQRAAHHRMVVERLHRALNRLQPHYLPQSAVGRAISYALNQWPTLARIIEHGEVELDNNLVENQIRPTAVGKKNWLFFGSEDAGRRNAVIYTLIANCRLHGVEPYAYLKDVLERLPTTTNQQVAELTPRRWQAARSQPVAQAV